MFRAVLTRVIALALVAALPTTGPGQCPCQIAKALTGPSDRAAGWPTLGLPPVYTGCCSHHHHGNGQAPADHPKPGPPTDPPHAPPCDHGPGVDAIALGGSGDRPERDGAASDTTAGWGWHLAIGLTVRPAVPHAHRSPARLTIHDPLRFAHAFRC